MASWIGVTTNAGSRLMVNWTSGSVITVNKAVAGTGVVSAVALLAQTDLVGEKQNASIVSSKAENDTKTIKIQIQAPEEGYILNQIGIFASLDDGDQVLIALFQNETGIPIPSASESPDFVYTFYAYLTVSNQIEFSCIIDPAAYVSQGTMEEYVTAQIALHADNRENPHGVTANQIGAVPTNRTVNGKALSSDVVLSASDVKADPEGAAEAVQTNLTNHNTDTKSHADLRASLQEVLNTITAAQAKLDNHNIDTEAHADIRAALQELSDWVKDLLDCDDETLNEMHEVVEYIKSNRSLIESITTSKVSVTDIVNDLVTNVANKPLSAAQGVALKSLIDTLQKTVDDNHSQLSSEIAEKQDEISTESWTFTLEDGSTVTKAVYVG